MCVQNHPQLQEKYLKLFKRLMMLHEIKLLKLDIEKCLMSENFPKQNHIAVSFLRIPSFLLH